MRTLILFRTSFRKLDFVSLKLLFLIAFFVACSKFSSDSTEKPGTNSKPNPSNIVYFLLENNNFISTFDPIIQNFDTLKLTQNSILDFSISEDGRYLLALTLDSLIKYDLLAGRKIKTFATNYTPSGHLSGNSDGSLVVYQCLVNDLKNICFFNTSSGVSFLLNASQLEPTWHPLLSPSGRWLAFSKTDGFYVKNISSPTSTQLFQTALQADQFSPVESYLTAEGKIFDLIAMRLMPKTRAGKIKFIDDTNIIWVPGSTGIVKKANISGTTEQILYSTETAILDFAISREKQFVISVNAQGVILNFTIFDFNTNRLESTSALKIKSDQRLIRLIWPEKPGSLSHDD